MYVYAYARAHTAHRQPCFVDSRPNLGRPRTFTEGPYILMRFSIDVLCLCLRPFRQIPIHYMGPVQKLGAKTWLRVQKLQPHFIG